MDHFRPCIGALRELATHPGDDPFNCVVLAEQRINEYLQEEIGVLRASLFRLTKAIDAEAKKEGTDWSWIRNYVQSCLDKLPGAEIGLRTER